MKYLALDIGDVICDVQLKPFQQYMSSLDIPIDADKSYYYCEEMQPRLDLGLSTIDSELDRICLHHTSSRKNEHHAEMKKLWLESVKSVPQINELLNEVSSNNVKIALLSNMGNDHIKVVRNIIPISNYVQHISCEVGARKPTKLYFQSFENEYPNFWNGFVRSYDDDLTSFYPEKPLYIDDRRENLIAGERYFITEHFSIKNYDDYDFAADALRKILIHHGYIF